MRKMRLYYPLPQLCRILKVSASGYYAWVDRPPSRWAREEGRLEIEIKAAHRQNRGVSGAETLQQELAERGIRVGISRIKRIKSPGEGDVVEQRAYGFSDQSSIIIC